MVIENLIAAHPKHEPFFYRTARGDEIDLVLTKGVQRLAFEIKASTTPDLTEGFWRSLDAVQPDKAIVIAPVDEPYTYSNDVAVMSLGDFLS